MFSTALNILFTFASFSSLCLFCLLVFVFEMFSSAFFLCFFWFNFSRYVRFTCVYIFLPLHVCITSVYSLVFVFFNLSAWTGHRNPPLSHFFDRSSWPVLESTEGFPGKLQVNASLMPSCQWHLNSNARRRRRRFPDLTAPDTHPASHPRRVVLQVKNVFGISFRLVGFPDRRCRVSDRKSFDFCGKTLCTGSAHLCTSRNVWILSSLSTTFMSL